MRRGFAIYLLLSAAVICSCAQAPPRQPGPSAEAPDGAVDRLLEQMATGDCSEREEATRQLAGLAARAGGKQAEMLSYLRARFAREKGAEMRLRLVNILFGKTRISKGHSARVYCLTFSPDGKLMATAGWNTSVRLWDPHTGECVHVLKGHEREMWSIAFSPDGKLFASGSWDDTARIWDPQTGNCLHTLKGHEDGVQQVTFSPDGSLLATASEDGTVRIWDARTGGCLHKLEGHANDVVSVAFSPDGKLLASASLDCTARIWSTDTGACLHTLKEHKHWVNSVAFSPDGKLLATAGGLIRTWDPATGKCLHELKGAGPGRHLVFSPDGKLLTSADQARQVGIWNPHTGEIVSTLKGHTSSVDAVAFSPDAVLAATATDDKIRLYSVRSGKCLQMVKTPHSVSKLAFSPDGTLLGCALSNYSIALCSANDAPSVQAPRLPLTAVGEQDSEKPPTPGRALSEEQLKKQADELLEGMASDKWRRRREAARQLRKLLTESSGKQKVLLEYLQGRHEKLKDDVDVRLRLGGILHPWENLKKQRTLKGHTGKIRSLAFSPDGRVLVSASSDRTVMFWDPRTGESLHTVLMHEEPVKSAAFSSTGEFIASVTEGEAARIWCVKTGVCLCTLEGASAIAFSPNGKLIATSTGTEILLWDPLEGRCVRTLQGHTHSIDCLTFSRDGKCLISAGRDYCARIWDPHTGHCRHKLKWFRRTKSLSLSQDGVMLVSAHAIQEVQVWNTRTGRHERQLKEHGSYVYSTALDPVSGILAAGDGGHIAFWNIHTGKCLHRFKAHENWMRAIALGPDGSMLASGSDDHTIVIWGRPEDGGR